MEFSSRQFADMVVAVPKGRIDHTAAEKLMRSLTPHIGPPTGSSAGLIIDLSDVDYISSVGLRVLMVVARQMDAHGACIAVAAMRPDVAEIFAISRFDKVLDVHSTVRAALESCSVAALAAFDVS